MRVHKIFSMLFCLFFIRIVFATEYQEMHVCSEAGFLPFEMRSKTGAWDGYDIALANMFAKNTGRNIILTDIKFDGLIPALLAKKGCDIIASAVGIDADRKKIALFSQAIYQSAYAGIVQLKNRNTYNRYEKINQKNVIIAVQQGTQSAQYAKNTFKNAAILLFENNSDPISAVIAGKVNIYIDDSVYLSIAVKRQKHHLAFVKPDVFPKNEYGGMGFLFRKSDVKFRDEFNQFFDKIKRNGILQKIQKYYFQDMRWLKDFQISNVQ